MHLKLTKSGSDRTCLVNMRNYETLYLVWDKNLQKYSTKISFSENSFIFVEESPKKIYEMILDYENGVRQFSGWESQSVLDHMEKMFKCQTELTNEVFSSTDF